MSPTLRCPECGASVDAAATFCPSCGEMILAAPPAAPVPPPAPAAPAPEPQVVPVPQRPTRQQPQPAPSRPRAPQPRAQNRPAPQPRRQQPQYQQPQYRQPQYRQPPGRQAPPQSPWGPAGGYPQGEPQIVRRGPGCGAMLLRLMLLLLAIPVVLGVLGYFLLGGSGTDTSAPASTGAVTTSSTVAAPPTAPGTEAATPTATRATTAAPTPGATTTSRSAIDDAIDAAISGSAAPGNPAFPRVTITGQECGRWGSGPYAAAAAGNNRTSCAFALAARDAYVAAAGNGRHVTIDAFSRARQEMVRLDCAGDQPVRCTSGTGGLVFLYGGSATFS